MDFELDEQAQAIKDLTAQVLGDASAHEHLREIERGDGPRFDEKLWASMAETGILGAFVPEAHGGAGLGLVALGEALEAAGRTAAAAPMWETIALGVLPVAEFAPDALASEVLPAVVAGEMVLTAGWHDEGSTPLVPTTVASRSGDSWALTGTKICVPSGMIADAVVVPAAVEGGSVGLFLAEAPAELIAEGHDALEWAYQRAVASQCSFTAGICGADLDLTAEYTKTRKQFDVAIATFQAVAHRAADSFIDNEAIHITAQSAMWRLENGHPAAKEVDVAKFWAASGSARIIQAGQHLHGGIGVDRDYPLHRFFYAAKQMELSLGTGIEHLTELGRRLAAESV
jgi:alkylation response protein AidB-like acyl-CoA dehydrogenase